MFIIDTIDHNILLNRLENYIGISGITFVWFKSYLSEWHQFVAVNEEASSIEDQYGVPQGSVLGLLLFTLYMLPLGNIIKNMVLILMVMRMILSSIFPHSLMQHTKFQVSIYLYSTYKTATWLTKVLHRDSK